jgi:hypothetical protein
MRLLDQRVGLRDEVVLSGVLVLPDQLLEPALENLQSSREEGR